MNCCLMVQAHRLQKNVPNYMRNYFYPTIKPMIPLKSDQISYLGNPPESLLFPKSPKFVSEHPRVPEKYHSENLNNIRDPGSLLHLCQV